MATRNRPPASTFPKSAIVIAVLIAGCSLTYGIVRAAGWLDRAAPLAQKPSREGMVPVPKALVDLRAFDVVRREDVYDLSRGEESYFWLPKEQVESHPEWFRRVDQIIGRVMARDKRADFVFSEKDFLPEGSRSGIVGGIASGKQGFFLSAEKIPGLRFLKSGDRFDLLASLPKKSEPPSSEYGLLMGGIKARGGKPIPLNGVRILAQNAEMIALTTRRIMTTQGGLQLDATDTRGRTVNNAKDEQVAIAIDPAEAVPLTQALGDDLEIHMVTRSGQEAPLANDINRLEGRIPMPATAVAVEAFQPIRASDLAEPTTGELRQYYFEPADIQDGWIARPEDLIGRVLRRGVEPGYIFSEQDFLPPGSLIKEIEAYQQIAVDDLVDGSRSNWVGRVASRRLTAGTSLSDADLFPVGTPPGLTAAIPADRMALTVDLSDVQGVEELSRGDRCDLLASANVDLQQTLQGVELSPALLGELQSRAVNRVLATDAIVVQRRDQHVVLATRPDEVSAVARALAQKQTVFCVARSHPSELASLTPAIDATATSDGLESDPDPLSGIAITESIVGGNRVVRGYRRGQ
ncbi:hypothetical protein EC9_33050 [Rosistilla ulvae]|uniref:Uncharacterized protein n=1 Tax=Rosistilla ulvae TaxID=1930277 RepID=A0A517M2K9_9BACT|nr:hypothetical protein [Rosistilla ulvae]QDS89108.1 hypothetical protein EC9_33050 [Rosistilla ulvae]